MSDEGTSFTIDLPVTGKETIDAATASMELLATRLDSASKASIAASQAMKAGDESYKAAEQSADRAAKALERVGLAADLQRGKLQAATAANDSAGIERATSKLRELGVEQEVLGKRATAAKAALLGEAAALDKLQADAKRAEDQESKLKKALESKASTKASGDGFNFEGLTRGLRKLGGPLAEAGEKIGELGSGVTKLGKTLGEAGPYVAAAVLLAALAAAFVAAAAAAVAATVKVLEWSVGLANANRNSEALAAGITRSIAGGQLLNDQIRGLTKTLPTTQDELRSTAQGLYQMGYRGKELGNALERAATIAAYMKFGPDFQSQMLSLEEQSKVFHQNLSELFGGLPVEGLLKGLQTLGSLLDKNTASGRAIKVVFESLFQPIVDWITGNVPKIERFFLQLEILALKLAIQFKLHFSTIKAVFEAFAIGTAVVFGLVAVAAGVLIAAVVVPLGILVTQLIAAGYAIYKWVGFVIDGFGAVASFLRSFSLADLGRAMMDGLVNGIKSGGAAVLSAVKGAVMDAVNGAKHLLGIASPSKVFADIGAQTGAGMAVGVESSAPGVSNAYENVLTPPPTGAAKPAASASPAASGSSSSSGANLSGATFNFYGVEGAENAISRFGEVMTRIFEGDSAQLGAGVVPT